jgi:hypothetical protein
MGLVAYPDVLEILLIQGGLKCQSQHVIELALVPVAIRAYQRHWITGMKVADPSFEGIAA